MTLAMLVLPMLAAFFAGAAFGVWWTSGDAPVTPHKDIDKLARQDRRPTTSRPNPGLSERRPRDRWT